MTNEVSKPGSLLPFSDPTGHLCENRFDPIETAVRELVRRWIQASIRDELDAVSGSPRCRRRASDG